MSTAHHRKRCFDQIQPIADENRSLLAEVDMLRDRVAEHEKDKEQFLAAIVELGKLAKENQGKLRQLIVHSEDH